MSDDISILRGAGIRNPQRMEKLIRETIGFLKLDLGGLTVLTEAASGPYVVTPVIAAMAGAKKVSALTRGSKYATTEEVVAQTRALESVCGVAGRVEIFTERPPELFEGADIVTNLGFVRPLDRQAVGRLKRGAVIPLMCEAWETRPGDIDIEACREYGIPVAGTNEDFPGLDVFSYSGPLCMKMLFEAQVEVHKSAVAVVGSDKFAPVIARHLRQNNISVKLSPRLKLSEMRDVDAVVIADYTRESAVIGEDGDVTAEAFANTAPAATIIQFAGRMDVRGLLSQGVHVYPGIDLPAFRMARTLADLGPRPVVELHAAGLKVGAILHGGGEAESLFVSLIQKL